MFCYYLLISLCTPADYSPHFVTQPLCPGLPTTANTLPYFVTQLVCPSPLLLCVHQPTTLLTLSPNQSVQLYPLLNQLMPPSSLLCALLCALLCYPTSLPIAHQAYWLTLFDCWMFFLPKSGIKTPGQLGYFVIESTLGSVPCCQDTLSAVTNWMVISAGGSPLMGKSFGG